MELLKELLHDPKFQWVGITAIASFVAAGVSLLVGIIGPLITIYNNKKTIATQEKMNNDNLKLQKQMNENNFKGNVVSKARIEWIQEVRKKSVDFMSACYNLLDFIDVHHMNENLDTELQKEFTNLKNEVQKNGVLLILYFGPDSNKNNDLIAFLVTSVVETLTNKLILREDKNIILYSRHKVEILKEFLRIYFKAEWKRANGEIADSGVQGYLETEKLYVRIQKICKDMLDEHKEWLDVYYEFLEKKFETKI
ncbi:hypothetical protein BC059799_1152 [Bacillus cereus NVH0597-99]|nr:hypothetical protein BC059799_1152 [Bacillus cereus NVH0597-99]